MISCKKMDDDWAKFENLDACVLHDGNLVGSHFFLGVFDVGCRALWLRRLAISYALNCKCLRQKREGDRAPRKSDAMTVYRSAS